MTAPVDDTPTTIADVTATPVSEPETPDDTTGTAEETPETVDSASATPDEVVETAPEEDTSETEHAPQDAATPDDTPSDEATFEPTPEPAAEPALIIPPAPVEEPRIAKGPGFLTLLLGGVIAGLIGYGAAKYDIFGAGNDDALTQIEVRMADQSARIETLAGQIGAAEDAAKAAGQAANDSASAEDLAALREQVENLSISAPAADEGTASEATDPALEPRISALEAQVDDLAANIETLTNQAADAAASTEAMSAYEAQLAALQEELDAQRAAIADAKSSADAARSSAADETRRITAQAALAQISAALESGAPFVDAVSSLKTAGDVDAPAALGDVAPSGVSTLSALQADYPAAARRALAVSIRENSGGGTLDRLGDFLKAQTGARSLDAKEGDDPDAILSRAEAALKSGDLATTLSEIASLPEVGQAEMADWSARARARLDAETALADLNATLNSN